MVESLIGTFADKCHVAFAIQLWRGKIQYIGLLDKSTG